MSQPLEALEKANAVRSAKSQDKAAIRRLELDPLEILSSPPEHWRNAEVQELLLAMPRVGPSRSAAWMRMSNVHASTLISGLSERQRFFLTGFVKYGKKRPPLTDQRGP
jgi:hypothetical protein